MQPGKYFGAIKSAVVSTAKSGSAQFELKVDLIYQLNTAGNWATIAPTEKTCFLSCHDNAWEYTEKKLKSLGFNGNFEHPEFNPAMTVGGAGPGDTAPGTEWEISIEEYSGKPRERMELAKWGGDSQPAEKSVLSRLSARWQSANKSQPVPAGRPTTPPASRPATATRPSAPVSGPVAPAVSANGSPAAVVEINNQAAAWAAYCDATKNSPDLKAWGDAIAGVMTATGKPEADFLAEDWQQVLGNLDCPF